MYTKPGKSKYACARSSTHACIINKYILYFNNHKICFLNYSYRVILANYLTFNIHDI